MNGYNTTNLNKWERVDNIIKIAKRKLRENRNVKLTDIEVYLMKTFNK